MGAAKALAAADALEACRSESRHAAAAREAAFRAAMDRKDAEVANVAAESLRQELHDAAAAAAVVAAVAAVAPSVGEEMGGEEDAETAAAGGDGGGGGVAAPVDPKYCCILLAPLLPR